MRTAELIASDNERSGRAQRGTGGTIAASTVAPRCYAGVGTVVVAVNEKVVECTSYGDVALVR